MSMRWIAILVGVVMVVPGQAVAQTEWWDDPANPVILSPGDPGAWDDDNRKPLAAIKVDGIYHLYYRAVYQCPGSWHFGAKPVRQPVVWTCRLLQTSEFAEITGGRG